MATISPTRSPSASRSPAARVARLRELAAADSVAAQDAAWAWFERLGRLAAAERDRAAAQLAELFGQGEPSRALEGPTDGILVAPLIHPRVDSVARRITSVWMPWMGKSFYGGAQRGENRLTGSTRWVTRLLWPGYSSRPGEDGRLAFDFRTRIERGAVDPDVDVLVIDYAPVEENPRLIIRRIRDELVEIVPGAHLGRILYRGRDGYRNIGYFALRTEV
jgi:hypothetical protein